MDNHDTLVQTMAPFASVVSSLDLTDRDAATRALDAAFSEDQLRALGDAMRAAHAAGTLTPRVANPTVSFGRVARPSAETHGCSIDAVDMKGAGPGHTHPRGEVSYCVPLADTPEFEGVRAGWAVMAAGSHHIPAVSGGRMLIVYFLPGGEVIWDAA